MQRPQQRQTAYIKQWRLMVVLTSVLLQTIFVNACGGNAVPADPDAGLDAQTNEASLADGSPDIDATGCADPAVWRPYSCTSSWPSIHGGPFNADYSFIDPLQATFRTVHVLEGWVTITAAIPDDDQGIAYVTTARPDPPNLFAFRLQDDAEGNFGDLAWSAADNRGVQVVGSGAVTGSPVLDDEGNVYVGDDETLWSFDQEGHLRWQTDLPKETDGRVTAGLPFVSLLFVPTGQVGGVTIAGRLLLFDRDDGSLVLDHRLSGALPFSSQSGDATDMKTRILDQCLWKDAQGTAMVDDKVRIHLLHGFVGVGMAVSNTPAVRLLPPESPGDLPSAAIFVPALLDSQDATGNQDLKLFRIDVRADNGLLTAEEHPGFDGLVPGGAGSATSPTLSSDGKLVFVGDDFGQLHAFDAETGAQHWNVQVGEMLGSITVDWPESRLLYVGTFDGSIKALDASNGAEVWNVSMMSLAQAALPPVEGAPARAVIDGVVMASANRLLVPVILGYEKDMLSSGKPMVWPMQAKLYTLDKSGSVLGDPIPLPDVADTGAVITRSGTIMVTLGSTLSSLTHCLWQNYPALVRGMPEPMTPQGGFVLLQPER